MGSSTRWIVDDRRDPARHPCGGRIPPDRPSRDRWACGTARRYIRRSRRPAGRDRSPARASRRRRRARCLALRRRRNLAHLARAFPARGAARGRSGWGKPRPPPCARRPCATRTRFRSATAPPGSSSQSRSEALREQRDDARDDKILLRRYHEDGDLQAREQLIEQYMSLVALSRGATRTAASSSRTSCRSAPSG